MKLKEIIYISKKLNSQVKHGRFYRFVTVAAIFSVMLGSMALLISMSVLEGFERQLAETAVNFTSHIKVEKYRQRLINQYPELIRIIKNKFPAIKSITPYIRKEALISTKSNVDGIVIKGISDDNAATGISDKIISGEMPKKATAGIILGEKLAKKINVSIGDSVVIFLMKSTYGSSSADEMPDVNKFLITGIYRTGMAKYDDIAVYCDMQHIGDLLSYSNLECSGLDIMLRSSTDIIPLTIELEKMLGYPFSCLNVYDLHGSMFAWIEMQKKPIPLVLGLISLVAVMNIVTILLILIVEKTHTIGILRTLGMKSGTILAIFLTRGTLIGIIGTLLGAGAAFIISLLQQNYQIIRLKGEIYFLDVLPISINWVNYALVLAGSITIAFLVTLMPALAALKVKPIKAINFK